MINGSAHNTSCQSSAYTIKVNGEELSGEIPAYGIEVNIEFNRIPSAKIIFIDGDPSRQEFGISNDERFVPGKEIEIFLGDLSEQISVFKGIVLNQAISVRQGSSRLEVDCRHPAYRMTLRKNSRYFTEMSDSDVAEQLLDNFNLQHAVASVAYQHPELVQYNVTDWDFLLMRMELNGFLLLADTEEINVAAPDFGQEPILNISFGSNVIEFDAILEARNQMAEVITSTWDYREQEMREVTAEEPDIELSGSLSDQQISEINGDDPIIHRHGGDLDQEELQAWADARLLKDRLSRNRGRVRFHGDQAVKPGQLLELQGFGEHYNGTVMASGVRHEFYNGIWMHDVEFGLSPEWFAETIQPNNASAGGLVAGVKGLQIGVVTKIFEEEVSEFRIKVRLPVISADEQGTWARLGSFYAGSERGSFFLPELDDEVIVGFINEDLRDAVILGALHSRNKETPFTASDDNFEKGIVSKEGLKIIFHEEEKSIKLETPGGNKLTISDDAKGLKLEDQNGNSIELNDNGIEIKSNSKIKLDASQDLEESCQNWKCNAQAQAELKTNGIAKIQGSVVNIN
ncbi:MAG: type VI secretion system tip protein VgrG [Fulvivirga sp.]